MMTLNKPESMTSAKRRVERKTGLSRVYAHTILHGIMHPFVAWREIWTVGDGGKKHVLGRGLTWTEAANDAIKRNS